MTRAVRSVLVVVLLVGGAALLAGCGSSTVAAGGVLEWRELTVDLPDGWVETNRTSDSITVGDGPGSPEPGERGDLFVATQFRVGTGETADDLRAFVEQVDGTLERDTTTEVGTLPATLIQYSFTTNGIPTRERVIVVASRDLVLLQQPVPMQGETEGPQWFDDHVDEFDALLEGITFGAPEDYLGLGVTGRR